jgi:hypothetical protein
MAVGREGIRWLGVYSVVREAGELLWFS